MKYFATISVLILIVAEKDVVVEPGKLWGKLAQLVASCRLYNFLLCHNVLRHYCY